ncbi:hypothetical protein [Streptococcus sinensis]|uniref:hypothetical protein n=1 Tax=Streptococcus TaxID=1301 RepID=UPI001C2E8049|nr:hypothetical protein [Streptococcus sinensis]MCD1277034.1 hypothetical protein [Streptococcus sinensis]MED5860186.1 hypothetical protein [Streptococcus anginosus]MED5873898.1 hypothetical protein [Streptococcus anginosus]
MRKKYLPKAWQVLRRLGKRAVRITLWGLFFLLRVILFYYLCRWTFHSHWLALLSGFGLACGSDLIRFKDA